MKLFQTETGKNKKLWHILETEDDRRIAPLCKGHGYWIGGYHNDRPEMTREKCKVTTFSGKEKICPACVEQAYIKGIVGIYETSLNEIST